jgi:hypothetical protein
MTVRNMPEFAGKIHVPLCGKGSGLLNGEISR